MRTAVVGLALAVLGCGTPSASATTQYVPAYGFITISDQGFGPRATWSYEGVLDCRFLADGPGGVPNVAAVVCDTTQNALGVVFSCPRMVVTRTTAGVVGSRALCDDDALDMGVGTSGLAFADLGLAQRSLRCEAYMDVGVLVPPYTVTCAEPSVPGVEVSLP